MKSKELRSYISSLTKLRRANTVYGLAPHKPVLLISLIELIENGLAIDNRFYVNTELVGSFQENWRLLVNTLHQPDFTLPFYHLQSEKANRKQLWFLKPKPGFQINAHIKSVTKIAEILDYGYFDEQFYSYLTDPSSRSLIKAIILDTYFPITKSIFIASKEKGIGYYHDLQHYILNESNSEYRNISFETEEDIFVRGGLFKKLIPKVYDSTCCFSGMKLESIYGYNFIDACHIMPFSTTHNDTVTNCIALCPNLHRAFDRGLLSIDVNFSILVSSQIREDLNHPYSISNLMGKKMKLPLLKKHYPSQENLEYHRTKIFKQ